MINYDPDGSPKVGRKIQNHAREMGLGMVRIICDEPGRQPGEPGLVSFIAFVNFLPRIGEKIFLEDRTTCLVTEIYHRVVSAPALEFIGLLADVRAVRISADPNDQ